MITVDSQALANVATALRQFIFVTGSAIVRLLEPDAYRGLAAGVAASFRGGQCAGPQA